MDFFGGKKMFQHPAYAMMHDGSFANSYYSMHLLFQVDCTPAESHHTGSEMICETKSFGLVTVVYLVTDSFVYVYSLFWLQFWFFLNFFLFFHGNYEFGTKRKIIHFRKFHNESNREFGYGYRTIYVCVARFPPWNIHLTWTWRRNGWKLCFLLFELLLFLFFGFRFFFFCNQSFFKSSRCTNMIPILGTVFGVNKKSSTIITSHCVKLISSICHISFLAPVWILILSSHRNYETFCTSKSRQS